MAYVVIANVVMACVFMAYAVKAYIVMACAVMACTVMAYIVMAKTPEGVWCGRDMWYRRASGCLLGRVRAHAPCGTCPPSRHISYGILVMAY